MDSGTGRARRSWRTVGPFLAALVAFTLLAAFNQARGFDLWRNYALTGVALGGLATWALWRWDVRIPHYIQWVVVAGLLLHYGGGSLGSPDPFRMGLLGFHGINGAYHTFEWWDHLTHGVGVGAGTMASAYLLEVYQIRRGLAWGAGAVWLVAVLSGLAMGVGVELYEYLGKTAFQTIDQGGYANTMRDLHYNLLGAGIGGGAAALIDRRRLWRRIERHWGRAGRDLADAGWRARLPAGMAGFVAFVAPAAVVTVALSARFLVAGSPDVTQDAAAYEQALQAMLWSAIAGAVLGPAVALAHRWRGPAGAKA